MTNSFDLVREWPVDSNQDPVPAYDHKGPPSTSVVVSQGMRRGALIASLAVGLSAGCKDAGKDAAADGRSADATEIRADFDRLCSASYGAVARGTHDLAPAPWAEPQLPGPETIAIDPVVISVEGASVVVDGRRHSTIEGEMAQYQELAAERGGAVPWILAPTKDSGVAIVASTLQRIGQALGSKGRLHFAHPTASLAPSPSPEHTRQVSEKVLAAPEDTRLSLIAQELQGLSGNCQAFEKVFAAAGAAPAERRCEVLAEGVPGAVVECRLDHTKILATLYVLFVGPNDTPARAELTVELAAEADADAIELQYPPGATWAEVTPDWFTTPPDKPIRLRSVTPTAG